MKIDFVGIRICYTRWILLVVSRTEIQYKKREKYAKYAKTCGMKMQYSQSNLVNYNSVFMIHFQFPFLTTCTTNIFQVKTVDIIKLFFYSIGINIEKVSYIE